MLDRVLERQGVERMPGPHCFAFYQGMATVAAQEILEAESEARKKKTALLRQARLAEAESGRPNLKKGAPAKLSPKTD